MSQHNFAKAIVIALIAAIMSWLPAGLLVGFATITTLLPTALLGSFAIGLPIAILVFCFAGAELAKSFTTLAAMTFLAGIMLLLASYAVAGEGGVKLLGIPAFIAAVTYGVLGWFWILKPLQKRDLDHG